MPSLFPLLKFETSSCLGSRNPKANEFFAPTATAPADLRANTDPIRHPQPDNTSDDGADADPDADDAGPPPLRPDTTSD